MLQKTHELREQAEVRAEKSDAEQEQERDSASIVNQSLWRIH